MGKVPIRQKGKRVLIICEGFEEYDYLNRIKECAVWSQDIRVDIKNAKSINEISARYEYEYQNGAYELIVIFCDTEKAPYEQFTTLKKTYISFTVTKPRIVLCFLRIRVQCKSYYRILKMLA